MDSNKSYRVWVIGLAVGLLALTAPPADAGSKARGSVAAPSASKASPVKRSRAIRVRKIVPARPSMGQLIGLHASDDPLDLKSGVALVLDEDTNEVLLAKNTQTVLPIASITKLMTALVVTEAGLPLDEVLTVDAQAVDTEKGSGSRLRVGTALVALLGLVQARDIEVAAWRCIFAGQLVQFARKALKRKVYSDPCGIFLQQLADLREVLRPGAGDDHRHRAIVRIGAKFQPRS